MSRVLAVVVGVALAVACQRGGAQPQGAADAGPTVLGAENVATVRRERIAAGPRLSGSLEARHQAKIRAELAGSVLDVLVELGQPVKRGQVMARLEDRAVRDSYASAQSMVQSVTQEAELSQRQLERTRRLVEAGALSARDLEVAQSAAVAAQARLADARARLAMAQNQLDAATVRSPLEGVVSERAVHAGDIVSPGSPLLSVIDPSSMRLQASVPSEELGMLEVGQPVQFAVRGYPGQAFEGKIEQIAPAADPATRQITVLVSIPNPGGKLISGLFADGRVASQSREALVAPLSAVEVVGDRARVLRVKDGLLEDLPVQIGLRDDRTERVEITSGLQEGDVLVSGAARTLAPGTRVQVTAESGGSSSSGGGAGR